MLLSRMSRGIAPARRMMGGTGSFQAPRAFLSSKPTIVYTETDEAPALATYSLLPIVQRLTAPAGIEVVKSDISLAGRIIGQFPKYLKEEERMSDTLAELGEICKRPDANVIKLPNISASIPQLNAAITELRTKGYGNSNHENLFNPQEKCKQHTPLTSTKLHYINPELTTLPSL